MAKWFKKAVMKKSPYDLGGWRKGQATSTRRSNAISSRPKNWSMAHRRLSAGRACMALANVTKDRPTAVKARADARYFFRKKH